MRRTAFFIVVTCSLIIGSSCEVEKKEPLADAGCIFIDGELYQTIDSVDFHYSKSQTYDQQEIPKVVYLNLHTETASAHYRSWGTIQIESSFSTWPLQRIKKMVVFAPDIYEDGIGIVFNNDGFFSFGEKETSEVYVADLVKTCTVKRFFYNTESLLLYVEIVLNNGHAVDILFSGPISQKIFY